MASLFFTLVFLGLCHSSSCSSTFYQRVSDDGDEVSVPTNYFHRCSIKNNCNYVGIPLDNVGSNVYSAATIHELQGTGQQLQIWKKVTLDDSSGDDSSNAKVLKSCRAVQRAGVNKNGIVKLSLAENMTVDIYCDMVTDEGGWIVFQKRENRSVNFQRNWKEYKMGFGDLNGNFWLGLENLHKLTSQRNWTLRVDLKMMNGEKGYAKYTGFKIGSREEKYKLSFNQNSYSGNIGDALRKHNGMFFSTYDKDNDVILDVNCASTKKGGWWFKSCYKANLNNFYPGTTTGGKGLMMSWESWKGTNADIVFSEMKIKEDDV